MEQNMCRKERKMDIRILQLLEGAAEARGVTVVIDVFRAFSLECYLTAMGAAEIRPVSTLEEAFAWKRRDPGVLLVGERGGVRCEGFDYGNSPSSIPADAVRGRRVIHTTSAGTQGVTHAQGASEILTGSLVNASAVASYLLDKSPETVSLVCMGRAAVEECEEDTLCAQYIKSLLTGSVMPDIDERIRALEKHGGEHFFLPDMQEVYPREDFYLCAKRDIFPFVLKVDYDREGMIVRKI